MKLNYFPLLILLLATTIGYSQRNNDSQKDRIDRVNSARIGFISERLKLSESEAEKFWPIYNEYSTNRQELFISIRKKIKAGRDSQLSANDKSKLIDETMSLKEDELELQKTYKPKFLKIISVNQYVELLNAEKDFNKLLMDKLRERREN